MAYYRFHSITIFAVIFGILIVGSNTAWAEQQRIVFLESLEKKLNEFDRAITEGLGVEDREKNEPKSTPSPETAPSIRAAPIQKTPPLSYNQDKLMTLQVQQSLADLGYNVGVPDGLYGTRTKRAILKFQRDTGLKETGNVSPSLLVKLSQQSVTVKTAPKKNEQAVTGSSVPKSKPSQRAAPQPRQEITKPKTDANDRLPSPQVATVAGQGQDGFTFPRGDAKKGKKAFRKLCGVCHGFRGNKIGPHLKNVFNREAAASEVGFRKFSPALKHAGEQGLVWTQDTLFRYSFNPNQFMAKYFSDGMEHRANRQKQVNRLQKLFASAYLSKIPDNSSCPDGDSENIAEVLYENELRRLKSTRQKTIEFVNDFADILAYIETESGQSSRQSSRATDPKAGFDYSDHFSFIVPSLAGAEARFAKYGQRPSFGAPDQSLFKVSFAGVDRLDLYERPRRSNAYCASVHRLMGVGAGGAPAMTKFKGDLYYLSNYTMNVKLVPEAMRIVTTGRVDTYAQGSFCGSILKFQSESRAMGLGKYSVFPTVEDIIAQADWKEVLASHPEAKLLIDTNYEGLELIESGGLVPFCRYMTNERSHTWAMPAVFSNSEDLAKKIYEKIYKKVPKEMAYVRGGSAGMTDSEIQALRERMESDFQHEKDQAALDSLIFDMLVR